MKDTINISMTMQNIVSKRFVVYHFRLTFLSYSIEKEKHQKRKKTLGASRKKSHAHRLIASFLVRQGLVVWNFLLLLLFVFHEIPKRQQELRPFSLDRTFHDTRLSLDIARIFLWIGMTSPTTTTHCWVSSLDCLRLFSRYILN